MDVQGLYNLKKQNEWSSLEDFVFLAAANTDHPNSTVSDRLMVSCVSIDFTCVCACDFVYVCDCVCLSMHVFVYMSVCHVFMFACIFVCMYVRTYVRIYVYIYLCVVQSRFAVIRVPEWTTSTLESTVSTLAEVSNQILVLDH